ncbi:transcription factor bHLH30-like [Coffea eugenioides]|uniref:transcription factor bHLH30-like n=1 Tax=Coffea eugenioides TaxID=49369 RepID=UPI000F611A64|nr:transcription factor bHLH30-like [Coffea eugenioides]
MHTLPSFYEVGSCSESYNFLHEILNSREQLHLDNSNVNAISMAEAKAVAANKSHSEAERRRRKRINGHLATLRNLLPKTIKADKASLLAEVVRCLRELKKSTEELSATEGDDQSNTAMKLMFPSETDELKLCYDDGDSRTIKATLCCEDRPEMMIELKRALNAVKAKVVKAEMATVGGRTKTVLWLQASEAGEEGLATIRRALKVVVDRSIMLSTPGQALPGNKRPRPYHC